MSIRIELLTSAQEACYEKFLHSVKHSLLYTSIKYRNFLKRILIDSQDFYLVAYESGELVGALPTFVKYNAHYGNVLNSLPFYGSNGGLIISPYATNIDEVRCALLKALNTLVTEHNIAVSTIILNPWNANSALSGAHMRYTLQDVRIGQLTCLPTDRKNEEGVQSALLGMFHSMRRRNIRKARKNEVRISHSDSLEAMQILAEIHQQNMEAIGGPPKPWSVFKAVREVFTYDQDYRVYWAEKNGEIIAALLLFFYNRTVEYYTPVIRELFRSYQPLSLLIYEAMQDAVRRGFLYWNWGGTGLAQDGVYHFKKRWGASDTRYYYYICEYEESQSIRAMRPRQILEEYPYFYVIPFHVINSTS